MIPLARVPTGQLRASLGLAQTALRFGQTDRVRWRALVEIQDIRAELRRRGERAAA